MLGRQLRSTLFPYTTLFRSGIARWCYSEPPGWFGNRPRGKDPTSPPVRRRNTSHSRRDRKSTRLNSSHLGISYAVFCLKKKKALEHTGLTDEELRQGTHAAT